MLIAITGGIGSGKSVVSQLLRVLGYTVYDCDARAKWVMTHDPLLRQQLIDLFGPDTYLSSKSEALVSSFKSEALVSSFKSEAPVSSSKSQTPLEPAPLKPETLKPASELCSRAPKEATLTPETLKLETLKPAPLNKPYLSSRIFSDPTALAQMNACVHPAVQRDLQRQYEASYPHNLKTSKLHDLFFFESAILFESGFDLLSHPDLVWTVSAPLELRISRAMQRDHTTREQVLARIHSQLDQEEKERRSDCIIYNDDAHSLIEQVSRLIADTF